MKTELQNNVGTAHNVDYAQLSRVLEDTFLLWYNNRDKLRSDLHVNYFGSIDDLERCVRYASLLSSRLSSTYKSLLMEGVQ